MTNHRFLAECEREALPFCGAIQPHGTLLAVDRGARVVAAADNTAAFLGLPATAWLGSTLPSHWGFWLDVLDPTPGSRRVFPAALDTHTFPQATATLDVYLSRAHDGSVSLEFYPHLPAPAQTDSGATFATPIDSPAALSCSCVSLTKTIAAATGFARVLYYRFRRDGDGEVIAEARDENAFGSYLGLRFPASDIPQVARQLYLVNPWRCIPDAQAAAVPVRTEPGYLLDLTYSVLRSVSPVHQAYLANMQVAASLSFAVVVAGELYAIVSAHHPQAMLPPLAVLEHCGEWVRQHALALTQYLAQERIRLVDGLQRRFAELSLMLQRTGSLALAWPELSAWLRREFDADGVTLLHKDQIYRAGLSFEAAALAALDDWFMRQQEVVFVCDSLRRELPLLPLSEVAGVLAIRSSDRFGMPLRAYLTRGEEIYEVAWGGNPDKPVERGDALFGIAPRRSFEKWIEKRVGYCREWDNSARLLALRWRELCREHL